MPNEGLFTPNLEADNDRGSHAQLTSTFQVADITRPMMNVSQICEQGFYCMFQNSHARIVNSMGETADARSQLAAIYTRP